MSKREIIDFILDINRGAKPEFLAQFSREDLDLYLEHLMEVDLGHLALSAQASSVETHKHFASVDLFINADRNRVYSGISLPCQGFIAVCVETRQGDPVV